MRSVLIAARLLIADLASTFSFLLAFLVTHNIYVSIAAGMVLGVGQIALQKRRRQSIDQMEWLSLFLVVGAGAATFLTDNPRYVMLKPSVVYVSVGLVMLRRGWMNRYLPPEAIAIVPDVATVFGYVWAALMFASALLNIVVALRFDAVTWAMAVSIYAIASKVLLFIFQFGCMRFIGVRRWRAMSATERQRLAL